MMPMQLSLHWAESPRSNNVMHNRIFVPDGEPVHPLSYLLNVAIDRRYCAFQRIL